MDKITMLITPAHTHIHLDWYQPCQVSSAQASGSCVGQRIVIQFISRNSGFGSAVQSLGLDLKAGHCRSVTWIKIDVFINPVTSQLSLH